ncbi:MAG: UDP-3-O-[3-hydroxymyristoyl] N-acetylglucosamine deacetylase [Acidobacteria bacterium]|nr:MAG: UDP-3-O-[3-hydroxymyristoyl] N-acetylglucosamine deacetylase [Acidobacteriota bacterium]PIE89728.1 MAG: UDP-3-O-[3-hydroxymyristoyl] N-acetylglucosamine deacetylase [Acidobacteriota bacterium]
MNLQQTLAEEISTIGIGLHSGTPIEMILQPSAPGKGIVFVRKDLNGEIIPVNTQSIDMNRLQLATTLRSGEAIVQTTEHLLSALYSKGIDNVTVILDGPEVPIMDGSAGPFIELIEQAGIKQQKVPRKILKITKPFHFELQGKKVSVKPSKDFTVSYHISFPHPLIGTQNKTAKINAKSHVESISFARTFGFLKDVDALQKMGLIKGGSIDNAIVLDESDILNDSLRSKDEFVSHKILDFIGDLAVSGYRFEGDFSAYKAGHEVHARFLLALLEAKDHYCITTEAFAENGYQSEALVQPAYA